MASKEESKDRGAGFNPPPDSPEPPVDPLDPINPDDGIQSPAEVQLEELKREGLDEFYLDGSVSSQFVVKQSERQGIGPGGYPIDSQAWIVKSSPVATGPDGKPVSTTLRRVRIVDQAPVRKRLCSPRELVDAIKATEHYRSGRVRSKTQWESAVKIIRDAEAKIAEAQKTLGKTSKRGRA